MRVTVQKSFGLIVSWNWWLNQLKNVTNEESVKKFTFFLAPKVNMLITVNNLVNVKSASKILFSFKVCRKMLGKSLGVKSQAVGLKTASTNQLPHSNSATSSSMSVSSADHQLLLDISSIPHTCIKPSTRFSRILTLNYLLPLQCYID